MQGPRGVLDIGISQCPRCVSALRALAVIIVIGPSSRRAQRARTLELRAATRLTRYLFWQGQRQRAMELQAPLSGWFSNGSDAPDVDEAGIPRDELFVPPTGLGSLRTRLGFKGG